LFTAASRSVNVAPLFPPVHITSEEEMEAMMLSALGDSYGFGII